MKTVYLKVKLKFPDDYTQEQITDIISDCDYSFNYPVNDDDTEVKEIESEIIDLDFNQ